MSQVRVHNFAISLDGFGTGDGITFDAPFGHAGERLHEWMFATRFWHSMVGEHRGHRRVSTRRSPNAIPSASVPRSWVGASSPRRPARGPMSAPTTSGVAGGGRTRRSTRRCSCSRITRARRSRWKAAPCSTSSTRTPQEALDLAREAAGDLDVRIGGGPTVVRDFLAAGLIDTAARRAGADPARPRRSALGRPRRGRGALRHRGGLVTERRHPPDLHTSIAEPTGPPSTECRGAVQS